MTTDDTPTARRGFLARLAALGVPLLGASLAGPHVAAAAATRADDHPRDEWLKRVTGKHRIVLDVEQHRDGHALAQAASMLEGWRDGYGLQPPQVSVVLGVRGGGLPLVLGDAAWGRFRVGEQWKVIDARTMAAYAVNPFSRANVASGGPVTARQSIEALQERGALVLVCRNTLGGAARRLAAAGMGTPEELHGALEAGLLPGVVVVPAMLIAFTLLQERGVGYAYAG